MPQPSRREVLAGSTGLAGFMFLPARVLGLGGAIPPSEKLNIGHIGVGGGRSPFHFGELAILGHNVAALCDVDWRNIPPRGRAWQPLQVVQKHPQAKKYDDWRLLLEDKNVDAVVVCLPDHQHAVISLAAMKAGKHVYTEKPIAHSVHEARAMIAADKKYKVATQSGCQGHASDDVRNVVEWIKDGAIGDVRDVRVYKGPVSPTFSTSTGFAAKSEKTPSETMYVYSDTPKWLAQDYPVPEGFLWDLWVGPLAFRRYNPHYIRPEGHWADWWDYGDGAIGDMCMHYFDPVFWALDLEWPEKAEANPDPPYDWATNKWLHANSGECRLEFPARGKKPPVAVTYHFGPDGGTIPLPKYWKDDYWPKYAETGKRVSGGGVIITGSKGAMVLGNTAPSPPLSVSTGQYKPLIWSPPESVRLIPDELDKSYKRPPKTLPRPYSHWADWMEAAKSGKKSSAGFAYGAPLAAAGLLCNVAMTQKGKTLYFDGKAGKITNNEEANRLLQRTYREGWTLAT